MVNRTIVRLEDAAPGDLVQGGIHWTTSAPRKRHSADSLVEHVAVVEHFYGPNDSIAWVTPICGEASGSANGPLESGTPVCRRCLRALDAR